MFDHGMFGGGVGMVGVLCTRYVFSNENSMYLFFLCYLTTIISLSTPSTVGVGVGLFDGGVFCGRGRGG